ncbi:hypothetical protein M23134_03637 [Microscilla marina ATCC 23134]|uniref:Uncharacterized protein n=1 Tax=Microscilla marina ATCC 23134 TaxID=313606 RepID=A1ZRT0_MICM2|nr:hypothetical protein M23134_03637 [Microscilla marina ATCC 23134]
MYYCYICIFDNINQALKIVTKKAKYTKVWVRSTGKQEALRSPANTCYLFGFQQFWVLLYCF